MSIKDFLAAASRLQTAYENLERAKVRAEALQSELTQLTADIGQLRAAVRAARDELAAVVHTIKDV